MKAIEYLKKLDRSAEIYERNHHTELNLVILEFYMDGITDMAISDPDITGREFDEILSTKREYIRCYKSYVEAFKEE